MRNVLITGASKGIGAATALGFAKEKANLFIHYSSDLQGAESVAAQSQVSGSTATLIQADLGTLEGVQAFTDKIKGLKIDVLVNNAGSLIGRHKMPDMPSSHWEQTIMLNLSSVFYITQAVIPHMVAQKSGWIVNCLLYTSDAADE